MSETALTRTARALDLVPFVVENPGISIEELALEFSTSPKQILADLQMIFMCGLPTYSTLEMIDIHFDDNFVSVVDPQVLDQPRALTKSETVALSLALSALSQMRGEGDPLREEILLLQSKISAALAQLDVKILPQLDYSTDEQSFLQQIEKAIKSSLSLKMHYISAHSDSAQRRVIAPQKVRAVAARIYVDAWDYESDSERTFRLDRIRKLELGEKAELPERDSRLEVPMIRIELLLKRGAQLLLEQNASLFTVLEQVDGKTRVEANVTNLHWISRALLPFGDSTSVVAPPELRAELKNLASAALNLYK
jgi:proteasome accessory factor C